MSPISTFRILFVLAILLYWTGSGAAVSDTDATVWFVVSPIDGNRKLAYLLPLSDPAQIDHARRLASEGSDAGESIVSARIAAGADGYNRNLLAPQEPLWSWHIIGIEGFGDFAIELCDGNPQLVEDDVKGWINNTGGVICFWGYTVSAELTEAPTYGIHEAADGGWYNPETPGQGLFLDVVNNGRTLFAGWLTFALEADPSGESRQRWYTALGPIEGSRADLDLKLTEGGTFDSPDPVQHSLPGGVGTLTIKLESCDAGTAYYEFSDGPTGSFAIVPMQPASDC